MPSIDSLFITIGIRPLGHYGQEPEPSQATGMALVRCILGKFLGVVCPLLFPIDSYPIRNLITSVFNAIPTRTVGRDNAVVMTTAYGLDGPGIESR